MHMERYKVTVHCLQYRCTALGRYGVADVTMAGTADVQVGWVKQHKKCSPSLHGFACSVTMRQCQGTSIFQTCPLIPFLCCTAEKGSLDSTSSAHLSGLIGKPVFSSRKLKVMKRPTLSSCAC